MSTMKIDAVTLQTLTLIEVDGNLAKITKQLDRAQYAKTNKVLELLGGKWNKSKKAHVFPDDCAELLADAFTTGEVFDAKKAYQEFFTPDDLADKIIASLSGKGLSLLEPNAGNGRIAYAAKRGGHSVTCVEIQPKFLNDLSSVDQVIIQDFLTVEPSSDFLFDAVVMNPPFTKSQDIKHVLHAYRFLKPSGQLRAIMSPGFTFRQDTLAKDFREFLVSVNADVEELPEGTFKNSGTNVKTVLVSIN